jgi:hypothetical protein
MVAEVKVSVADSDLVEVAHDGHLDEANGIEAGRCSLRNAHVVGVSRHVLVTDCIEVRNIIHHFKGQ